MTSSNNTPSIDGNTPRRTIEAAQHGFEYTPGTAVLHRAPPQVDGKYVVFEFLDITTVDTPNAATMNLFEEPDDTTKPGSAQALVIAHVTSEHTEPATYTLEYSLNTTQYKPNQLNNIFSSDSRSFLYYVTQESETTFTIDMDA